MKPEPPTHGPTPCSRSAAVIDYAPKSWLRRHPSALRVVLRLVADTLLLAAFLFALASIISQVERLA